MVPRFGWPEIPFDQWRCTAAKGATHALPRALKNIPIALNLTHVKDMEGNRIMQKLARPRKPTEKNPSKWFGTREEFERLYAYCKDDVLAERALSQRIRNLSAKELAIWQLDQKLNDRGVMVDIDLAQHAITLGEEYKARLKNEFTALTRMKLGKSIPQAKFLSYLQANEIETKNVQKGTIVDILKDESLNPQMRRVLQIKQELNKTSVAKYQKILTAVCEDHRLRDLLMYHGASTGRWSGRLVQPQNLPRNSLKDPLGAVEVLKTGNLNAFELLYPDVMDTLSKMVRLTFIASPGKIMYGGDYSAIEARVVLWLAGDERGLDLYRKDMDLYKDLATTIYHTTYDAVTKDQRDMGKRGILGCGYGMGAQRFKDNCKEVADLEITFELAQKVIDIYRAKYRKVVELWYAQENAAIKATQTKKLVQCGKVLWGYDQEFLYCRLPSGRCLAYYKPKIEPVETPWGEMKDALTHMGVNSVTRQWERQSTYGGKLVENITQAVARDLIAEAMLRIEDKGYEVLLSIHDEILSERLKTTGSVEEFTAIMSTLPVWAEGLPVAVEGWSGERYLK
jgi:DNA polymerase